MINIARNWEKSNPPAQRDAVADFMKASHKIQNEFAAYLVERGADDVYSALLLSYLVGVQAGRGEA